jgi:hypothetical protein
MTSSKLLSFMEVPKFVLKLYGLISEHYKTMRFFFVMKGLAADTTDAPQP